MKTSVSKLLVVIVCVAMAIGVLSTVALAETNTLYSVWVDGIQVTEENKNDVLGTADGDSATVTYNPATNTLTLNNMSISGDGTGKGIVLPTDKDSSIVVLGTNTISNYQQGFTSGWENAYEVSLTLSGGGSLSVKDCNIMSDGSIHKSIYVDGITLIGDNANGIVCDDDFIVKNGAVVDLKIPGGNSGLWDPVYVNGNIEIYDSTVTIDGGATYGLSSVGYNKTSNHMKIVNSSVTLKGEGWGTYVGNNPASAATLYIKDSTINVQSPAGIYVTGDAALKGNVKILAESNRQLVRTANGNITVDLDANADIQGFINAKNTEVSFVTDYTLTTDWTVTEGRTLTVPEGVTLTLAEGVTITREDNTAIVNNGTIMIPCKANNVMTVDTGNIPQEKHSGGQATCREKAICEVCNVAYGEKLAHTPKVINTKEATATEKGYTGDTVCAVCGYEIAKGEDIPVKAAASETGDNASMFLWAALLIASGACLIINRTNKRKMNQ